MDIQLPWSANGFVLSISIYSALQPLVTQLKHNQNRLWLMFVILCMSRMWDSFLSLGASASNLLPTSYFPTSTESNKLPWGTILDLLCFLLFKVRLPKSLSHPLWHLCLCGTIQIRLIKLSQNSFDNPHTSPHTQTHKYPHNIYFTMQIIMV